MHRAFLLFLTIIILLPNLLTAGNAVWWEGENTIKNDFVESSWLNDKIKKTRLSKMKWLNCMVKPEDKNKKEFYSAEYDIVVSASSEFQFWAREFYRPSASPWKYRFDDGQWVEVNRKHPYLDISGLGRDRSVVWCNYGKIKLQKGKHKLQIQIYPRKKKDFLAGFDCFLLIDIPFAPSGWKKPQILAASEYIGTSVWIEGENAKHNFINEDDPIIEKNKKFSNGKWLPCAAKLEKMPWDNFRAKWEFVVPIDGIYYFWSREHKRTTASPFRYRFNNRKWHLSTPDTPFTDTTQVTEDRAVSWVKYEDIFLAEGKNSLEIEISGENVKGNYWAAFDCFCLSIEPFFPHGKNRLDSKRAAMPKGWFSLRAPIDTFDSKKSVFDLSRYNDRKAGIHGHCEVDEKGFVFEDGTRPRFWGINAYNTITLSKEDVNYFVRHMAKFGINLIRINGPLSNSNTKTFGTWDPKLLKQLHYFVATCKKAGIYVILSHYSPFDYEITKEMILKGYDSDESINKPFGLLMINKEFQKLYKEWSSFLNKINPYTKFSLADDPAVLWFEIQNEDSLFFWTATDIPKEQMQPILNLYNTWLSKRYGGEVFILNEWSIPGEYHPVIPEDGRKNNRLFQIMKPWTFTREGLLKEPHYLKRKTEQLRFIAEIQRNAYTDLINFLRKKRKLKCLISVGNWTTVDPLILDGIEHWTYMPGDIIDRHIYFNAPTTGSSPFMVNEEQQYLSKSALFNLSSLTIAHPIYPGKGNTISEISWPLPNDYRSEAVPLIAAYGSLHGIGACIWVKAESPNWVGHLSKYSAQTPATMGIYPGYALMFRRGDIKEGKTVIKQSLSIEEQIQLKGSGFDLKSQLKQSRQYIPVIPKDKTFKPRKEASRIDFEKLDPASLLIGKVERSYTYGIKGSVRKLVNLSKYHNKRNGTISSSTKELILDYKKGILKINTPRSQAIVGFLKNTDIQNFKDLDIKLNNEYGNVLVTSLDDNPIAQSKHLLIQSITREKNLEWKTESIRNTKLVRLVNTGNPPIIVEEISGYILLHNKNIKNWEAWKLNANGYRTKKISVSQRRSSIKLILPNNALFVELIKK